MNRFRRAFDLVIDHEGGFQADRADRGNWTSGVIGKGDLRGTKFGISAMAYPHLDIRNLTLDQARDIYFEDYWKPAGCELLPDGVAYAQFDAAVNHGVSRAIKILQGAIGAGPDGIIGPITRRMIKQSLPEAMIRNMLALRVKFYMDLDHLNDRYGLGWSRRSVDVVIKAMEMARPSTSMVAGPDELLAAYMAHPDVPEGSARHRIAGALMDIT